MDAPTPQTPHSAPFILGGSTPAAGERRGGVWAAPVLLGRWRGPRHARRVFRLQPQNPKPL